METLTKKNLLFKKNQKLYWTLDGEVIYLDPLENSKAKTHELGFY